MSAYKFLSALLVVAFTLSACAPAANVTPSATVDPQAGLFDQEWVLQSLGAGSETAVISGSTVTLTLGSDGTASGSAGCNSFGGSYTIKGDQITFSDLVSTLMACLDDAVTVQEKEYLEALASAGAFTLTGDTLTIAYNDGQSLLSFAKASALPEPSATPAPMSLSSGSTLYTSAFAGLAAFSLQSTQVSTAVPPGQAPISTAAPTATPPQQGMPPISTEEPEQGGGWVYETSYLDDRSTATGLLASYFSALNRKEYLRAYAYWRTPELSLGKYENFAAGFKQTATVKFRVGEITQGVAAGQIYYSVPVLIRAVTTTGLPQRFIACYVLQLSQPAAQGAVPFMAMGIARAKARLVETPGHGRALLASACSGSDEIGIPLNPAPVTDKGNFGAGNYLDDRSDPTQVLRSLVNAINRKEYVRAYSYWEHLPGMANVPPFEQFMKGYADTKSVDLRTGMVKGDAGAGQFYYSIPVLMIAQTNSGAIQTFVGCYHLHITNPILQSRPPYQPLAIQTAEVQQVVNGGDPLSLLITACNP